MLIPSIGAALGETMLAHAEAAKSSNNATIPN